MTRKYFMINVCHRDQLTIVRGVTRHLLHVQPDSTGAGKMTENAEKVRDNFRIIPKSHAHLQKIAKFQKDWQKHVEDLHT